MEHTEPVAGASGQESAPTTADRPDGHVLSSLVTFTERLGLVVELALTVVGNTLLKVPAAAAAWIHGRLRAWGPARRIRAVVGPLSVSAPTAAEPTAAELTAAELTAALPTDGRAGAAGVAEDAATEVRALTPARAALAAGVWVLAVSAWALQTVLARIDGALQQMGSGAQSVLGFPLSLGEVGASATRPTETVVERTVATTQAAWEGFRRETLPVDADDPRVLRDPRDIADTLFWLDLAFIAVYVTLLAVVLLALMRINHVRRPAAEVSGGPRHRRHVALFRACGALGLLLVVDVVEDLALRDAYAMGDRSWLVGGVPLGPFLTGAKFLLAASVVATAVVVGLVLAGTARSLARALVSCRGVLYGLAALMVLLLRGIGADQMDDVIRAWNPWRALYAAIAAVLLGTAVAGVIKRFTSDALDRPDPARGRPSQALYLGAGLVLCLVGQVLRVSGLGWGVTVPGLLLVAIWAAGVPFASTATWPVVPGSPRPWRAGRAAAAVLGAALGALVAALTPAPSVVSTAGGLVLGLAALAALDKRGQWDEGEGQVADTVQARRDQEAIAQDDRLRRNIASWGDRIGHVAGSAVPALLVVSIARAVSLDRWVDREPDGDILRSALVGLVLAALGGGGLCALRSRRALLDSLPWWFSAWMLALAISFGVGLVLWFPGPAVVWSQELGTIVIVFGAFALGLGLLAAVASLIRLGPVGRYQLAPALRALRLRRFPVVPFLLAWVVIVANLDQGGFHDIRRDEASSAQPPTVHAALAQFLDADPRAPGAARPVVLVGANGGGIRAAVWTALVMECLFGPGGVEGTEDGVCAHDANQAAQDDPSRLAGEAAKPVPVFLASGASGGSVGLAAWAARRADLVDNPTAATTPGGVDRMLSGDLVAPLVGRLALADLPNALLAAGGRDRAALLEQGWEEAYADSTGSREAVDGRGLRRGIRDLWDVTHASGAWSTPVLALNGTEVEDGCRFLVSAVDFRVPRGVGAAQAQDLPDDRSCRGPRDPRDYAGAEVDIVPSTNELVDYLCPDEDVPLSTAAHLSARFPYVSPTGRVVRRACGGLPIGSGDAGLVPGPAASFVADGGMFDNSGAGTAVDTWRALAPYAKAWQNRRDEEQQAGVAAGARQATCLVPIFVQIDNSPPAGTVADVTAPDRRPYEVLAPVGVTAGQIGSRENYARSVAAAAYAAPVSADGREVAVDDQPVPSLWFRISLFGQPGPEPPLGWTLAPETVDDMRAQLNSRANVAEIQAVRTLVETASLRCR